MDDESKLPGKLRWCFCFLATAIRRSAGQEVQALFTVTSRPRTSNVMAKEKNAPLGLFFRELFQLGIYKRSQGRVARQATFGALFVAVLLAAWRLSAPRSAPWPRRRPPPRSTGVLPRWEKMASTCSAMDCRRLSGSWGFGLRFASSTFRALRTF